MKEKRITTVINLKAYDYNNWRVLLDLVKTSPSLSSSFSCLEENVPTELFKEAIKFEFGTKDGFYFHPKDRFAIFDIRKVGLIESFLEDIDENYKQDILELSFGGDTVDSLMDEEVIFELVHRIVQFLPGLDSIKINGKLIQDINQEGRDIYEQHLEQVIL